MSQNSATPDKFRILIIEDDPFIARLVVTNLQKANLDCRTSKDGIEGLKDFKDYDPHLVISDIMMPGIDGREVCQIIREISMVPVLLMTAADTSEAEKMAFKAGADDYIAKPFDPQLLTMRVTAHLRRVYRYDANIYRNAAAQSATQPAAQPAVSPDSVAGSQGTAPGFMTCQTCGYHAPRQQFTRENSRAQRYMMCPQCQETALFTYG